MVLYGTAGVMVGLTVRLACTLSGVVVGRCLGGTVGGGIDFEIVSWHGAWHGIHWWDSLGTWAAIAGDYSVFIVIIVGKDVEWVIIACMALIDQWHLSDGIRCCDVVRCSSHPWWWSSCHPWTWCNNPWIWCIHCWWGCLLHSHDCSEFLAGLDVLDFCQRSILVQDPQIP
jgi:hypothetical protein